MKRLIPALVLLLSSCGPTRETEIFPRYAVLTNVSPQSPMFRSVQWLARVRLGTIVPFTDIERETPSILRKLRELQPAFVAVVLRPEDLDANFQFALFELSCRLDSDSFPDFAWGYFLARDPAFLERQMQTIRGAEAKAEKRLLRLTHVETGAAESRAAAVDLEWATRLPCRLVSLKPGDLEFLRNHRPEIENADFLIFEGEGSPEGFRGLPPEEVRTLRLDTTVAFSAGDYTGAVGAAFETAGAGIARRPVTPDRSFAQSLIGSGTAALFAPLHRTNAGFPAFEWASAILHDAPLGEAMKRTYDLSVLSSGYATPVLGRFVDGRTAPTGHDDPAFMAVTRVLFGDPVLQPFVRPTLGPLSEEARDDGEDSRGNRVRRFRWKVVSPDCAPFFADPFSSGKQRIYLRAPVPYGTRRAAAELTGCEFEGKKVPAVIEAQALEHWRDETLLHVLVRGDALALKGLEVSLSVTFR